MHPTMLTMIEKRMEKNKRENGEREKAGRESAMTTT